MPDNNQTVPNPLIPAVVSGGSGLLGGTISAISSIVQNKKNRQFAKDMYSRQYQDNLNFWNMQNTYNSPQEQMKRYQEAGLNKNLVFGAGNPGNAGSIAAPDVSTPDQRTPDWGAGIAAGGQQGLQAYFNTQIQSQQVDNMKKQGDVLSEEIQNKRASTIAILAGADRTKYDLDIDKILQDVAIEFRHEQLRSLRNQTDLAIHADARAEAKNKQDIEESVQRILTARTQNVNTILERENIVKENQRIEQQIANMKQDGTLRRLEIMMAKKGINASDPTIVRMLSKSIDNGSLSSFRKMLDSTWNWFTK